MKRFCMTLLLVFFFMTTIVALEEKKAPIGLSFPAITDIQANWITFPDLPNPMVPNLWFVFRKSVSLDAIPEKALCRIACDSKYWLWINGKMVVFEGGLKRGPTPHDTYCDLVDLKPYLKKGENTIAVQLWFFGKSGFSHIDSGKPGLLFDASQNGENGLFVISNADWKVQLYTALPKGLTLTNDRARNSNMAKMPSDWRSKTFGPFEAVTADPQPNYRLPEWNIRFDARYDFKDNWKSSSFNDSNWSNALECGIPGQKAVEPWGHLYLRPTPLWKNFGLKNYVNADKLPKISDGKPIEGILPYNAQVTPFMTINAPNDGMAIDIRTENYHGGSEYNVRAEYITKKGVQSFETPAWMNGHRVIYSIPEGIKIVNLQYRETGFNSEIAGSFRCDDAFYNRLWTKAARTLYITMRDTYFDCPDRERAQWWGDAVNELGEAFYAMDRRADTLPRKGFYELFRFQKADNSLHSPIPGIYDSELPAQMLATIGSFGLGTYSLYSGDQETAKDLYYGVKKYLSIWEFDDSGLIKVRKGGWSWGDWGQDIDLRPLMNCWYYLAVKEARRLAMALGEQSDADLYDGQMKTIQKVFNKEFWTGKDYRDPLYKGRSDDRTNAMAVLCHFPEKEWYPLLREHFRKEKNASPYMEKYVLEALCQLGYGDDALIRMKERFGKMVNNSEYSTLWEGWGIGSEGYGGGTVNHAWSGGGLTCLAQYIVGLVPIKPAFETFGVYPQLGSLKYVELKTLTKFGDIEIKFRKTDAGLAVRINVPEGTTGTLGIPSEYLVPNTNISTINVNNLSYTSFNVKPGIHEFEFKKK